MAIAVERLKHRREMTSQNYKMSSGKLHIIPDYAGLQYKLKSGQLILCKHQIIETVQEMRHGFIVILI